MTNETSQVSEERRKEIEDLIEKLQPEKIYRSLAFAGIYQIVYEAIKKSILYKVKNFYGYCDFGNGGFWNTPSSESRWEESLMNFIPAEDRSKRKFKAHIFRASVLWLIDCEALSREDAEKIEQIKDQRDKVAHECLGYVISPQLNIDTGLLDDGMKIVEKLEKFWLQIEIETGGFGDHLNQSDIETAASGTQIALRYVLNAYKMHQASEADRTN